MMDPNLDRRKVWWAVLASIVAHLLIGLSLAAFGGRQDVVLEEQQVPQLTIMQAPEPTPPPLVPKNAPMTTVDPARKSAVAPKEKTFEANENSIAAAEKAATTDNPLPGQDGKDRPFMNLDEHDYSLANKGAAPQPKPSPTPPPEKQPTPNETPTPAPPVATSTPAPDQLALLTQTPSPIPSPPESEEKTEIPTPAETPTPTPEPVETPPPSGLQLQGLTAKNGDSRRDQQPRPLGFECGRYAAGKIQKTARRRDRVALVLLYGGEDRFDQHRDDCGQV